MNSPKISPSKSSPSQNITMLGILFMLISIVATYMFLAPNLAQSTSKLANNTATLHDITDAVNTLNADKTKLDSATLALANKGVSADFLQKVTSPTEDIPGLYLEMENVLASASQVSSLTYQIGSPLTDVKSGVKIVVIINAKGKYANLKDLLSRLEHLQRPITFSSLSFSQSQKAEDAGLLLLTASGFFRAHGLSDSYAIIPNH